MQYWLDLFTGKSWKEYQDAGASISGFRESRLTTVKRINPGNILVCYLTGISRFCGALEVIEGAFSDASRIWSDDIFPARLRVRPLIMLKPEESVPITELSSTLSFFKGPGGPKAWGGYVRGSPSRMSEDDGNIILAALKEAKRNPIVRPFDPKKLERTPLFLRRPPKRRKITPPRPEDEVLPTEEREHLEMQWLLLKLGSDMGLSIWVARNDRGKSFKGQRFIDLPQIKESLPQQFDPQTNRIIEHIDVLWLRGNSIERAFEIEHSTNIYSGILRMSDLLAMQPNLDIKLYIVAPDARRERVRAELNRPTFSITHRPLPEVCKFLPYSAVRREVDRLGDTARYVRPEIIDRVAESCED